MFVVLHFKFNTSISDVKLIEALYGFIDAVTIKIDKSFIYYLFSFIIYNFDYIISFKGYFYIVII